MTSGSKDPVQALLAGELQNSLTAARLAVDDMVRLADDLDFEPSTATAAAIVTRKTLAIDAVIRTTEKALELVGGRGYYRTPSLTNIWNSAPFFHNNGLGLYNGRTDIAGSLEAYEEKFGKVNPNRAVMRQLRDAGVDIVVCGQSMMHNGFDPDVDGVSDATSSCDTKTLLTAW